LWRFGLDSLRSAEINDFISLGTEIKKNENSKIRYLHNDILFIILDDLHCLVGSDFLLHDFLGYEFRPHDFKLPTRLKTFDILDIGFATVYFKGGEKAINSGKTDLASRMFLKSRSHYHAALLMAPRNINYMYLETKALVMHYEHDDIHYNESVKLVNRFMQSYDNFGNITDWFLQLVKKRKKWVWTPEEFGQFIIFQQWKTMSLQGKKLKLSKTTLSDLRVSIQELNKHKRFASSLTTELKSDEVDILVDLNNSNSTLEILFLKKKNTDSKVHLISKALETEELEWYVREKQGAPVYAKKEEYSKIIRLLHFGNSFGSKEDNNSKDWVQYESESWIPRRFLRSNYAIVETLIECAEKNSQSQISED